MHNATGTFEVPEPIEVPLHDVSEVQLLAGDTLTTVSGKDVPTSTASESEIAGASRTINTTR